MRWQEAVVVLIIVCLQLPPSSRHILYVQLSIVPLFLGRLSAHMYAAILWRVVTCLLLTRHLRGILKWLVVHVFPVKQRNALASCMFLFVNICINFFQTFGC